MDANLTEEQQVELIKKFWKEDTLSIINHIKEILNNTDDFKSLVLEKNIKEFIEKNDLSFGKVMNPLRLCLVGTNKGPHLFDIIELIGRNETLTRIDMAISTIEK